MVAQSQPSNYHGPAACQATNSRVLLGPMDLQPLVQEVQIAVQEVWGPTAAEAAAAAAEDLAAAAAAAAAEAFAAEAAAAPAPDVKTSDVKTSSAAAADPAAEAAAAPAPDVKTSDVKTSANEPEQELAIRRYKHMALRTDTGAWAMTFSEQLKRTRGAHSSLSAKQLHESS